MENSKGYDYKVLFAIKLEFCFLQFLYTNWVRIALTYNSDSYLYQNQFDSK